MGYRREYFKRVEYEGQVHIRSGGLQESISLCGWNDFCAASDSTKAVTCNECRSIANYCQDHVRLRPPKKARRSPFVSNGEQKLTKDRKEREEFELWVYTRSDLFTDWSRDKTDENSPYHKPRVELAWQSWQASRLYLPRRS